MLSPAQTILRKDIIMNLRNGLVIAATAMLSACGGEDVASTPPPPAETYPATANADVRNLTANETFASNAAKASASGDINTGPLTSSVANATDFVIRYDASDNAYTLTGSGNSYNFAKSSLTVVPQNNALLQTGNVDLNATTASEGVLLLNPAKVNLTYVDVGYWKKSTRSGNTMSTTLYSFAYGVETPTASVPRTGSATYSAAMVGALADNSDGFYLLGALQFGADFQAGTINVTGGAAAYDETGVQQAGVGSIRGNGQISSTANSFDGNISATGVSFQTQSAVNLSGTFAGQFYGPTAQEIGGTILLSGSGMNAAAAFGGTTGTLPK
jgi:hypothetical protein